MSIVDQLERLYWQFREAAAFADMVDRWRRTGHPTPVFAANHELVLRAFYLEAFRDFASDAFVSAGATLAASKAGFIGIKLSPKTTTLTPADAKMLRSIIQDMGPDEAFHGEAKRKWDIEIAAFRTELLAEAYARRGHSGRHPLVSRVLRAN